MTRTVVCVLLLGVSALPGCGVLGGLDGLRAQVRAVSVADRSPEGLRLEIVVDLENTSDEALPLVSGQYTLTLEQAQSHESSDRLIRTLPAAKKSWDVGDDDSDGRTDQGRQVIRLPLAMPWDGRDAVGLKYRVKGTVSYRPPGEIRALLSEAKLPLPLVYFNGAGHIQ